MLYFCVNALYLRKLMSSHECDNFLDELLRQALHPFAVATPPAGVWSRVRREVSRTPFSRWSQLLSRLNIFDMLYAPQPSAQPYCIQPHGSCLPSAYLFSGLFMRQIFTIRVMS